MIYAFIEAHPEHPVVKWATHFEVSTSGYYTWRTERADRQARADTARQQIRDIFEESGGTYGADRICGELRKRGQRASFARVKRMMNEQGLRSVHLRYRRSLTDSRKARGDGYPNLLRNAPPMPPLGALSSDISYIPTDEGFDYLCTIRDIRSGIVLAYKQSERMTQALVIDTLAILKRRWNIPKGAIFHSDRGSQYTAHEVMNCLAGMGLRQSFSRVGMPGDNPWSESFFSILKKEAVHPVSFHTRQEARVAIFAYVDGFYNTRRIQKRLGYLPPIQWLDTYLDTALPATA